ncbi:hypothetical protein YPPY64_0661, partial [Yersinia pestis PY-64]
MPAGVSRQWRGGG